MVEKLVKIYDTKNITILDIGTGTGCILLSILSELKNSKGVGIDICQNALIVAHLNSKKHKLNQRTKFYKRSLNQIYHSKFDLIVSNPPYIKRKDIKNLNEDIKKFEPKLALDGGNDGLDVIKKVIYKSKSILKVNGMLALEIGNEQYKKVSIILKKSRFKIRYLIKDYRENIRCILSTLEN
jgi:release factor glutamine methyltransferase